MVIMKFVWEGLSSEEYDQIDNAVGTKKNPPKGLVIHTAAFDGDTCHIFDIWQSEQDFNNFAQKSLGPVMQKLGLDFQPDITMLELHDLQTPAYAGAGSR